MSIVTVDEFTTSEVGLDAAETDIFCAICGYRGRIHLSHKYKTYKNPNYASIVRHGSINKVFIKWVELQPDAIKCVLETMQVLLCSRCSGQEMRITSDSRFNPKRIIESLECHKSSS